MKTSDEMKIYEILADYDQLKRENHVLRMRILTFSEGLENAHLAFKLIETTAREAMHKDGEDTQ